MGDRRAKDALFEGLAGAARAFSNGRRAEIVDLLAQGDRSVEDIAAQIDQSVANTSHHLRTLARAGLVEARRDGTKVWYSLASSDVLDLWSAIGRVGLAHGARVDRLVEAYLGDAEQVESIGRTELAARVAAGDVVVLDVRPRLEYLAGHIAGARSVPVDELEARLDELPHDVEIVAYCRGPYCVFAHDAVRLLSEHGRTARQLEDGFLEWRRDGLPVAVAGVSP